MGWIWAEAKWSPLVLLAACVALCTPVKAGDWVVTSHIGETVEANDNPQQLPHSPGGDVGSLTDFSFKAINETPTLNLEFDSDLAFRAYGGPGAQSSLDGLQGNVGASVEKNTKLTDYHLDARWQRLPASVSELTDSGVLAANTTRSDYFADGGLQHQIDDVNGLGWSATGTVVDFSNTNAGLTPYTDATMTESWIHNISPITNFTASLGTEWYVASNLTQANTLVQTLTGQIDTQLTPRVKFMGRLGGGAVHTTEQDVFTNSDVSQTSGNFIAAANLIYELSDNVITATASHDFAPSSLGQIQDRTLVGVSIDHKINESSGLLLSGQLTDQLPSTSVPANSDRRQAMILSVAYSHNLMRDWDMVLSYRFVQQEENAAFFVPFQDGASTSNAVFLTLTRNVALLQ